MNYSTQNKQIKSNESQIIQIFTNKWVSCQKCEQTLCRQKAMATGSYFFFNLETQKAYCTKNYPKNQSLIKIKACSGCKDIFPDYGNNYDYCQDCALNGSRYARNQCPECGDSSGWIKINQKLRACKACHLTKGINYE